MLYNKRMKTNVSISIIVPAYNCVQYLPQCIDSLLNQTFHDFELIIIDDGSTDGTFELAKQYEKSHSCITAIQQPHKFAGVARNHGLEAARGDYVIFLDGDDYFEPTLLEDSYSAITNTDADICVFGAYQLNNKTGEVKPMNHTCRVNLCPNTPTFNHLTNPRNIFCFTTPAPWTKMFKRSFIEEHRLQFQDTRSANDLRFVFTALAIADKITAIDKRLVTYRKQNNSSLQSTQANDPFAFYQALISLRDELQAREVFNDVHHAFVNVSLDACMYNLRTLAYNQKAQRKLFYFLKRTAFDELELSNKPRDYFYEYPNSRYNDFLLVSQGNYKKYREATTNATKDKGTLLSKAKKRLKSLLVH